MRQPQIKQCTWPVLVHHMVPTDSGGDHMPCCGHGCQCRAQTWATNVTFVPAEGVRALRRAMHRITGIPEHLQCVTFECVNRSFCLNKAATFDLQRLCETNQQSVGSGAYICVHSLPPPPDPPDDTTGRWVREEGLRSGTRAPEEAAAAGMASLDIREAV